MCCLIQKIHVHVVNIVFMYMYVLSTMPVTSRRQTLFRHVFWSCSCIQNSVSKNFHWGWGPNVLCTCKCSNYWCNCASQVSPTLSRKRDVTCNWNTWWNEDRFLHGPVQYQSNKMQHIITLQKFVVTDSVVWCSVIIKQHKSSIHVLVLLSVV
jgi:hypothetical protein